MAKKIEMKRGNNITVDEAFKSFITSQKAKGLSETTIKNYYHQLKSISYHLDTSINIGALSKSICEQMVISMRDSGLSHNSVATYARVFHNFLTWCNNQGLTCVQIDTIAEKDTVRETYSDYELSLLLKRPSVDCDFCEFRSWAIINFLMNSGCRAATVRNIQNRDIDFDMRQVTFRHTKSGRIQAIPLCSQMVSILNDYMRIRGGEPYDYLFCDEYGNMLTENALRISIKRYNVRRGVNKTSIHMFRHTFARKYLIDCGGDAFTLQHLLGHSTLNMTKRYCNIFDSDLSNRYDTLSPLMQMQKTQKIKKIN